MNDYCMSPFFGESSNLKKGCKKDAIHDASDIIYVSCIHNSNRNILSALSGNSRYCPLSTSLTSGITYARAARTR